jgi:hypothetical protein
VRLHAHPLRAIGSEPRRAAQHASPVPSFERRGRSTTSLSLILRINVVGNGR